MTCTFWTAFLLGFQVGLVAISVVTLWMLWAMKPPGGRGS